MLQIQTAEATLRSTKEIVDALGLRRTENGMAAVDRDAIDRIDDASPLGDLALIAVAASPSMFATNISQEIRLRDLAVRSLDMSPQELEVLLDVAGAEQRDESRTALDFHGVLVEAIRQMRLHKLFTHSTTGEHHRGICPLRLQRANGRDLRAGDSAMACGLPSPVS